MGSHFNETALEGLIIPESPMVEAGPSFKAIHEYIIDVPSMVSRYDFPRCLMFFGMYR